MKKYDHELRANIKEWLRANAWNYEREFDLLAALAQITSDAVGEHIEEVGPCPHRGRLCGCPEWREKAHPTAGFVS